jgi:hypothetical protein
MLCRDWGNRGPWPTWPKPDQPDFTHMSRKVKEVIRAAGLRDELSFASFRHGGFHRRRRRRTERPRDHGAGPPHDAEGASEVREACHETDHQRDQKTAGIANKRRTFVQNEPQYSCPNGPLIMREVPDFTGAGEGKRTLVFSLEVAKFSNPGKGHSDILQPSG